MLEQVLTIGIPALVTGAIGYAGGRIEVESWKSTASFFADKVTSLRHDLANTRQSYLRQLDSKDDAIRSLNFRLVPLEAREAKRLAQLRSIAAKGAAACHAKRREKRAAAVAKTLAALPSLSNKTESGAGKAAA